MKDKDKILSRIKKLLNLQSSAETLGNEGEAYAAASAVHRLLTTYNLSLRDISEKTSDKLNINKSEKISYRSSNGNQWKLLLLNLLAVNNYCGVLVISTKQRMRIVGQEDNVVVVKNLYDYLVSSFSHLAKKRMTEFEDQLLQEGRKLTDRGKKNFLRSYFIGTIVGLRDNFSKLKPTPEENGLMVCHTTAIKEFINRDPCYTNKNYKNKKIKADNLMSEGIVYGRNDGRNINLNKQLQM